MRVSHAPLSSDRWEAVVLDEMRRLRRLSNGPTRLLVTIATIGPRLAASGAAHTSSPAAASPRAQRMRRSERIAQLQAERDAVLRDAILAELGARRIWV